MSSYPIWKLSNDATSSGTIFHAGKLNWNTVEADSFQINFIDSSNTIQTLWFRYLGQLLQSFPIVYLYIYSDQNEQSNNALYIIKSLKQNNNIYTIGVQYRSSTRDKIGEIGSNLKLTYYAS
jgi:hypothetical protein